LLERFMENQSEDTTTKEPGPEFPAGDLPIIVAFDQGDGEIINSFCAEYHFNVRKSCSIVFRQALTLQHRGKRPARNYVLRRTKCHMALKCELFGRELHGISTPALSSLRSVSSLLRHQVFCLLRALFLGSISSYARLYDCRSDAEAFKLVFCAQIQ
jgi:hypothetical protein